MCWTDHPEARAILAGIAASPPRRYRYRTDYALTSDEWTEYGQRRVDGTYVSPRLRRLAELHSEAFCAAEKISREAACAVLDLDVQEAVRRAVEGGMRHAA